MNAGSCDLNGVQCIYCLRIIWMILAIMPASSEHSLESDAFVLNQVLNMHFIYLAGETWMLHLTLYLESDAFVQAALFNVYSSQCLTQIWMLEWGAWATVMYCLLSDVCCGFLFLADIKPCIWLDPVSITQSPWYPCTLESSHQPVQTKSQNIQGIKWFSCSFFSNSDGNLPIELPRKQLLHWFGDILLLAISSFPTEMYKVIISL